MAEVFDYYHLGLTDRFAILSTLRDKLIEYGWTIDYDGISSNDRLTFHVTNTQCYFSFHLNDLPDGQRYYPFTLYGFLDNEITKWFPQDECFFCNPISDITTFEQYFISYKDKDFYILDSFLLINDKLCFIVLKGYFPDATISNPFVEIFGFGQLNIFDELNYGNFFLISPRIGIRGPAGGSYNNVWVSFGTNLGFYYKNKKQYTKIMNCCYYKDWYYNIYSWPLNLTHSYFSERQDLPQLTYQPIQFERIYLRTYPLIAEYQDENGIFYRHIVCETPCYFCYYPGKEYFDRIITYNNRKFKIYPWGYKIIEEHNLGIAFEVGNL